MSTKRQPNTAERLAETNASGSNNSSDRVHRNTPAASNAASPQVAQVIMIEEKPLHGNDGANDSGTSKKPRRRRRDPKAPLQDAGPGRHATTSGGNGGGSGGSNNKGYAGREKRVPGSGGIRFERGGKKAMASKGKEVATGSVTGAPAPQRSDPKSATQIAPRTRGNTDTSTDRLQHEQRATTVSRNKKIRSEGDATPKRSSRYTGKQSAESTTAAAAPGSSKPVASGRMSKTLQHDIEDQRRRKNPKSEDFKANHTATSSSTLAQTAKKGRKSGSRRVSGGVSQIETDNTALTKAQSKAEEESEGPLDEGKEKPSTKVCIRWLPADLPEHIFWKSVEPALPWFDPEHVGSVTQREREVLCAVTEENDNENDDEFDRSAIEAGAGAAGEPQIAEKESNDEPPSLLLALAETKMAMVDVYESNNLAKLDSQPYWRQYSQGKRHRSKAKPDDPSRAYILFAEAAEADHFYRHFHGHAFGKNGVINRAVVELAPFQHVFWTLPTAAFAASDPLDDTLDADPHFIAFLKSEASKGKTGNDNAPSGGSASSSAPPPVTALAEPQTARISYAAAAASLGKDSGSSGTQGSGSGSRKENKAVTPLIEYLRRIKTTGTARRPPPTQAAKTAAASPARPLSSTKASAVNNKAGGKKGASKSTAASAAPKRPRRRKQ